MTATELLDKLTTYTESETIHMYIIERKKKQGAKSTDKASDRFEYVPLQITLSKDLVPIVQKMLKNVINKKVKDNVEIRPYEVIDDTEEKIQVYSDLGKITGFQDFLTSKLGTEIKKLNNYNELDDLEKAWALCYGFYNKESRTWMYCIKKLSPRQIAVDVEVSHSIAESVKNGLVSFFDMNSKQLKPFNGFTLNIEPSIDMIYLEEEIYVFRKKAFEDITSLTEEFIHLAEELINEVTEIDFVEGVEFMSSTIKNKPAFRNKLIKAKNIGNIDFLRNCRNIKKEFNRAGKKLNIKFNFDASGKIIALNEKDAENIIKVLSEYFKEGIFGGKVFESPAGRLRA